MSKKLSDLCVERMKYQPNLPKSLREGVLSVVVDKGGATTSARDHEKIKKLFPLSYGSPLITFVSSEHKRDRKPLKAGVLLSGGQAPGGHNVIAGLFDGIKSIHPNSQLFGFLGGPSGLVEGKYIEITSDLIDQYRNMGGFDIIGSGRTKLESEEQFDACIKVAEENKLDCIVVIGGDDSNTNAAVLAEYFKKHSVDCSIIGCPKTIDGDLRNKYIETPFGFDTACKTYSQLIGNIARDANSARKYWHFIKIMGRSASHIALEVACQTQPNYCIISEEVEARGMTLSQVVSDISDVVEYRASKGKNFGIVVVPEGLIEFIPDFKSLISELNDSLATLEKDIAKLSDLNEKVEKICSHISDKGAALLKSLPNGIREQLLMDRDPHGNVQVSLIETEKLLIELVAKELKSRKSFKGKFKALNHFFGYEGRCAHPSNFDSDYGYSLGFCAAALAFNKLTGYIASVSNLSDGADNWVAGGVPTTMLMNIERRHGEDKPVIQKALVELDGNVFKYFCSYREEWAKGESYLFPGAIQYFGPSKICDSVTMTLTLSK